MDMACRKHGESSWILSQAADNRCLLTMTYLSFNFLISGRVQGVYFRAFAKGIAHDVGVVGWVRNDTRGNVEGVAQGVEEALSKFKKALYTGPPHARVTNVEVFNERALENTEHDVFEVRL
ncbi:hypothetical protein AcV7_002002 [Taiwanofungus camphoratus]|nr:hypothetical protein AcV7_002002 [Antrodia cinnamomea]